jgi:hypothetical protein
VSSLGRGETRAAVTGGHPYLEVILGVDSPRLDSGMSPLPLPLSHSPSPTPSRGCTICSTLQTQCHPIPSHTVPLLCGQHVPPYQAPFHITLAVTLLLASMLLCPARVLTPGPLLCATGVLAHRAALSMNPELKCTCMEE